MAASQLFDIAIYGSTSAAVASAVQAATLGRSVALVSPHDHIGGIQIEGLGGSDIDNQPEFQNSRTLGGLNLEFHRRVSKVYGRQGRLDEVLSKGIKDPEVWRFESRVAEKVIWEWLAEFPSIVIVKSPLAEKNGVRREGNHVKEIVLENGSVISAKIYIEASYEGDFLAAAGISTVSGRESRDTYNESLAGVRESTIYRQITVPVDPYIEPGNPSSGLLFGISPEPFGVPGDGDLHLQAFSYRLPLTDAPDNRVPFTMPEGYDPAHYELHRRFFNSGGEFFLPQKKVPNNKTDIIGSEAPLAMDLLGMNDEWPTASYARRREILDETARFTKGLLWFITTDPAVPDHYRQEWARYGYCRDEFTDNGHFPRQLYVRDARRMVSDYIITEATASRDEGEPQVSDPVAVAFWPTDTHSVRRILRDGKVHNEGFIFKGAHRWRPFGIAYRSLVPKRDEVVNVITPTCPSSSHVGYGAVRLEHQFYTLGQVCGNACDLALADGVGVQDVPYDKLRLRLADQGVVLNVESVGVPSFDV